METIVIISRTWCRNILINCLSRFVWCSWKVSRFMFFENSYLFGKFFSFLALFNPLLNFLIVFFQRLFIIYQCVKIFTLELWRQIIFIFAEIRCIFNFFILYYIIISRSWRALLFTTVFWSWDNLRIRNFVLFYDIPKFLVFSWDRRYCIN